MPVSAARRQQIVERRARVAALRLAGVRDQRRIAGLLGVALGTVNADFAALDAEYRARAAADVATEKGLELARCEALLGAHWPDALRGRGRAAERVLACMRHKARLLGLEEPLLVDLTAEVVALARELGVDEAEAVAVAEEVVRSRRRRGRAW